MQFIGFQQYEKSWSNNQTFQVIIGKQIDDDLIEFKRTGDESVKLKLEEIIKFIKEEKVKNWFLLLKKKLHLDF